MVIGFDASRAFIENRTGTENYSYQLLKALVKADKKNKYIVYLRPHSVIPASCSVTLSKAKGINWPRFWTQGGLALQTFKDDLDVLFVPAHTLPLIRKPGLKTVVTVHDLGSEYLPQTHQLKQRFYLGLMQKFQLKGASKIIAVSEATKKDLVEKLGIEAGKIVVLDGAGNLSREYSQNCGLIQATQNPWNPNGIGAEENVVWMITGLDVDGVRSAAKVLINNHNELSYAFAIVINEGIIMKIP